MNIINKIMTALIGPPKEDNKMYKTIRPYKLIAPNSTQATQESIWVFDDPQVGLHQEGLVDGIDQMLDEVCNQLCIDPVLGLQVHFADKQEALQEDNLPIHITLKLQQQCEGGWRNAGALYQNVETQQIGWLCANLAKYFDHLPETIYISHQKDILPQFKQAAKQHGYDIEICDDYYLYQKIDPPWASKNEQTNGLYYKTKQRQQEDAHRIIEKMQEFPEWKHKIIQMAPPEVSQEKWVLDILNEGNLDTERIQITVPPGNSKYWCKALLLKLPGCRQL